MVVTERATELAPTREDAQRAADALVAAGVREVWLYGSVARGAQHWGSDIDLVAILDDLEYRKRWRTTDELREVARRACGQRVEVLVTDRAEWRIQREQVPCSFANAIACELTLLGYSSDPLVDVDWDKEQVLATSNEDLAAERVENAVLCLAKIRIARAPGPDERELAELDDPGDYLHLRGARLIVVCEAADMAIENAAKALAVFEGVKAKTLWSHDVGAVVDALDDEDVEALKTLMAVAPDLIKSPKYITMWRTVGVYGTPGEGKTVHELATPQFATAIGLIACDVVLHVVEASRRRIGDHEALKKLSRQATAVREQLTAFDIATGAPRT